MLPTNIHNTSIVSTNVSPLIDIELWSESDVYNWAIQARQGEFYADILRENHIDGRALINLSYQDIYNMKIQVGPAKNLYQDIEDLKYKRKFGWAYEKVTNTLDMVATYVPPALVKVKDYSIEGMIIVKDYSVIGYHKVKEIMPPMETVTTNIVKVGRYIPVVINKIRGNNMVIPDRMPLLLDQNNNNNNNTDNNTPTPNGDNINIFNLQPTTNDTTTTTTTTTTQNEIPMFSNQNQFLQHQQEQQQQQQPQPIELPQTINVLPQQEQQEEFSFDQQTVGDENNKQQQQQQQQQQEEESF